MKVVANIKVNTSRLMKLSKLLEWGFELSAGGCWKRGRVVLGYSSGFADV
jgi:hypothetical protein